MPLPLIPVAGWLAASAVTGFTLWNNSRGQRHKRWRAQPFPEQWKEILNQNVLLYTRLPDWLKLELQGHVLIFLEEKRFEGCGGLQITDEIRVTIAGLACLLLLNRDSTHYHDLTTILVYPTAYFAGDKDEETRQVRLGESWVHGTVVLSWCDVTNTAKDVKDGRNLVLHEFAHQLDQEDGVGDGVPTLELDSHYITWAQVLSKEYETLVKRTQRGNKTLLRAYGATNPAEFFAVATEVFFEQPQKMQEKHPELYQELKQFYRLDPVNWKKNRSRVQF
jgi:MtfA peptidase